MITIKKIDPRRLQLDAEGKSKFPSTKALVKANWPDYLSQDANEDFIVTVKPRDIRDSIPRNPMECAFAHAIKRQSHDDVEAIVCQQVMMLVNHTRKTTTRFKSPPQISKLVRQLDDISEMPAGDYKFKKYRVSVKPDQPDQPNQPDRPKRPHNKEKSHNVHAVAVYKTNWRHWIVMSPVFNDEE